MPVILVEPHPSLAIRAFTTTFASPLGEVPLPSAWPSLLRVDASTPMQPSDDGVRARTL
jgi:hypothetical protein